VITAIVLVETEVDRIPEAAAQIAELAGVSEVYSVTGDVDLVTIVRVHAHEELADVIADRLSKVPGVRSTKTYLAFQAYSRHDLEAAFAIGFDGPE
jgi:DNA-binding Lrp family transcriptional regulator